MIRAFAIFLLFVSGLANTVFAQESSTKKFDQEDKFRQLEEILPTPNTYRTASGAPGASYWQQRANYDIDVELDDENQKIIGSETITYFNKSPDKLNYVWLQLDANIFRPDSASNMTQTAPSTMDRMSFRAMKGMMIRKAFDGGCNIDAVTDANDKKIKHTIVDTMMRVDLPKPLLPGGQFAFKVKWNYKINDAKVIRARTGYEYFPEDKNYLYEIAHWFPRMCAYTDATGWQHKQFLGRGEFTLEMGNYVVRITAPNDHIVSATGVLLNGETVLTKAQQERLEKAKTAKAPMYIVTPEEALANEKSKPTGKKTWIFKADDVRDFAFASSRKFIWDAMGHEVGGNKVMAMSFFPKEGDPLWSRYSTHSIIHTLNVYSRYTFKYPYPTAISVNGPIGGMEYPMICFNGPRPEKDGTYSPRTKYGLISVIIHEVGHNYFPMIVNTDERQWTWMDEGINTFLQYLAEQEWEDGYPSRRGEPKDIVGYMASTNQVPIMTNSESILQFGPNAYSKPATALNILRETILGRELFDFAFKEYALRWEFKRPMPADFFRTMEDASGVDLDWFWRGWFFTTDHCDLAIGGVRQYNINTKNPEIEKGLMRSKRDAEPITNSKARNKDLPKRANEYTDLKDFYNSYDPLDVTENDKRQYQNFLKSLDPEQKKMLESKANYYIIDVENVGGLVMPVVIQMNYDDGTTEEVRIPAEIWRQNNEKVTTMVVSEKQAVSITLDPKLETADVDLSNNHYPPKIVKSRFELFKSSGRFGPRGPNAMQQAGLNKKKAKAPAKKAEKKEEKKDAKKKEDAPKK